MNASAKVEDSTNFQIFRECLSAVVLRRGQEERKKKGPKKRRTVAAKSRLDKVDSSDTVSQDDRESPEDVAEFIDVGIPNICRWFVPHGKLLTISDSVFGRRSILKSTGRTANFVLLSCPK